jgi:hypothetical protein
VSPIGVAEARRALTENHSRSRITPQGNISQHGPAENSHACGPAELRTVLGLLTGDKPAIRTGAIYAGGGSYFGRRGVKLEKQCFFTMSTLVQT